MFMQGKSIYKDTEGAKNKYELIEDYNLSKRVQDLSKKLKKIEEDFVRGKSSGFQGEAYVSFRTC